MLQKYLEMTNYILSLNENSKRGKLIKLLLAELSLDNQARVMSMDEFEKEENKVIAKHIKQGLKGSSYTFDEAKKELLKIRKAIK